MAIDIRRTLTFTLMALIIFGALTGCSRQVPLTIWSTRLPSPNGLWVASASTESINALPGENIFTVVYLKRTQSSEKPTQVLLFHQNEHAQVRTINLTMRWTSEHKLEITYGQHADLDFQVVKMAGIDISVEDVSAPI